jgi:3-oxoacyl-[acyl-carrier protein] reductase
MGRRSMAIKMDVPDRDQVAAVFAQVKREFGSIDILVIYGHGLEEQDREIARKAEEAWTKGE